MLRKVWRWNKNKFIKFLLSHYLEFFFFDGENFSWWRRWSLYSGLPQGGKPFYRLHKSKEETICTILKILKTKPPNKYLLGKHRFQFLLFEYLDNQMYPVWKLSINRFFTGPLLSAFLLNTGKYGPEKILNLDIFHALVYRRKRNN